MIPFLAPLLGSLAGSLLPASVGTSIAGAVGASGAMGGLIASAAPKAIGAGIGTLIAGGDLGEAAANAAGFGLGGAAMQQGLGGLFGGAGAEAAAGGVGEPLTAMRQGLGMMGQAGQAQQVPEAPPIQRPSPQELGGMSGPRMDYTTPQTPTIQVPESPSSPYMVPGAASPTAGIPNALSNMGMPSTVDQMISSLGPNAPSAQQMYQQNFGLRGVM
jgi:hypothetical protein